VFLLYSGCNRTTKVLINGQKSSVMMLFMNIVA